MICKHIPSTVGNLADVLVQGIQATLLVHCFCDMGNAVEADVLLMQGALSLGGAYNSLSYNTFANNSAGNRGGAIMYTQQTLQTSYLQAPGAKVEVCVCPVFRVSML